MKMIFILMVLMFNNYLFSQLTVDAGKDTVFCFNINSSTYTIGANPTAFNGTAPYSYKWSIKEPFTIPSSSITLHASDFLSDTTISNPNIIDGFGILDSIIFYLEVEDGSGIVENDSVLVHFSLFTINSIYVTYNLLCGDSIFINYGAGVSGGLGNLSYLWQPNIGLIDSTNNVFWAKPEHSIDYYCIVKDTNNCTIITPTLYHVNVGYLNIKELISIKTNSVTLYPNPSSGYIHINTENISIKSITISDINNNLLKELDLDIQTVDLSFYPKGIYFIKIETETDIITKKIILL